MATDHHIGIDMGGTNIRGGLVHENTLHGIMLRRINAQASSGEVLQELFSFTDTLVSSRTASIGIGVPGLVDVEDGIVYDVINIPSWKEVPLQKLMQERYRMPVLINNDANCFALGEFYFGKGKGCTSMVGLTIGTGLGSGLILNKRLYAGKHGGAGEFGTADYIDKCYEYYASGQFFRNVYQTDGETVFKDAEGGNEQALKMYEEMGRHLGNAIKNILYALDVELIVLGGSVRHAFRFFSKAMWERLETFAFKNTVRNLKIEISELENSGILGAAALYYDVIR